jgi:hypothetical protein
MAKKPEASNASDEQLALTKGKTPRNAIMSIGILAAVVIGVLGFFYELKATNKAEQDARDKKTLALKSSTDVSGDKGQADINQMISAQRDAAASGAAARAASDVAVRSQPVRPMLTGTDFQNEVDKSGIDTPGTARHAAEDGIYTASIFKTSGTTRSNSQQAPALPPGVPSLEDARAARNAENANANDGVADQIAELNIRSSQFDCDPQGFYSHLTLAARLRITNAWDEPPPGNGARRIPPKQLLS